MSQHDFAVWLNGWVELNGGEMPDSDQWKMIVEHLNLVFKKVTPPLRVPPLGNKFGIDLRNNLNDVPFNDLGKVPPVYPTFPIYQPNWINPSAPGNNTIFC